MEAVVMMVYLIIVFIILCALIFGAYVVFDYASYKRKLEDNLEKTNDDINYNFDMSSQTMQYVYNETKENENDIKTQKQRLDDLSTYTSNTSNFLAADDNRNKREGINVLNNFDNALNKYFTFNDNSKNIKTTSEPNNKIFNYVFGTDTARSLDLIAKTTAYSGITVNTDINKEFKICNYVAGRTPESKCIKTSVDQSGNFIISSENANNIKIKNNNPPAVAGAAPVADTYLANFDTAAQAIYFGGDTPTNSKMYINNNGVYFNSDVYMNGLSFNTGNHNKLPIYTTVSTTRTAGAVTTNVNLTMTIKVFFNISSFAITSGTKLYISPLGISGTEIDKLAETAQTTGTITFANPALTTQTPASGITYEYNGVFNFNSINQVPLGHVLTYTVTAVAPSTTSINSSSFATSSYFFVPTV